MPVDAGTGVNVQVGDEAVQVVQESFGYGDGQVVYQY